MTFESETFMKKITLKPIENIHSPRVFLHRPSYWAKFCVITGLMPRWQTYLKHWIDDIPHDIQ